MVNARRVAVILMGLAAMLGGAAPAHATGDGAAGRIVNGTVTDIREVPWQVSVYSRDATGGLNCGGSILSATLVLTAAHCLEGVTVGADPHGGGGLGVVAGISDIQTGLGTDSPQDRRVSIAKVHPLWAPEAGVQTTGDLALLTLDQPLDLSGPTARAIALPALTGQIVDGDPIAVGPAVSVSGFGLQDVDDDPNGLLYSLKAAISDPKYCDVPDNAISLCVRSPSGVACSGDSGGPLVAVQGGEPLLVGVVSNGPASCGPGDPDSYVNLAAPENRAWIAGLPFTAAPRVGGDPSITAPRGALGGTAISCTGSFSGTPTIVKWTLSDAATDRVLATGRGATISYIVQPADVGHFATCRGTAANAGGVAVTQPVTSNVPMSLPVSIASVGGGSGGSPGPTGQPVFRLPETAFKVTAKRSVPRGKVLKVNASLSGMFNQADTGTLCVKQNRGKPQCISLAVKGQAALVTPLRFRISKKAKRRSLQTFVFTATVIGKNPATGLLAQQTRTAAVKVRVS